MSLPVAARSRRAFEEMRRLAVGWLAGRDAPEPAKNARIR